MKKLFTLILTLWCLVSFSQSRTKLLKDTIDIKVPLDKQVSPSKVRELLKSIVDKKEILSVEPAVNPNPNYVDKGSSLAFPSHNKGGLPTAFKMRVWRGRNMESFDFVLSKNSDLSSPTHVFSSTTANPPIVVDSNFIYFWKYRAKNANYTGAWSNIKRFDTYALPIGGGYNSIFDLEEFVPFVTRYWQNEFIEDNEEVPTKYRIGAKQVFNRHVRGTVTIFPFTVQTGLSQIVAIHETACMTEFAWGSEPYYLDINPFLNLSGSTLVLSEPATTFPISKIYSYVNIFYLK